MWNQTKKGNKHISLCFLFPDVLFLILKMLGLSKKCPIVYGWLKAAGSWLNALILYIVTVRH